MVIRFFNLIPLRSLGCHIGMTCCGYPFSKLYNTQNFAVSYFCCTNYCMTSHYNYIRLYTGCFIIFSEITNIYTGRFIMFYVTTNIYTGSFIMFYVTTNIYTGSFIMFSVITNIYTGRFIMVSVITNVYNGLS
jgi:hypothetical protein